MPSDGFESQYVSFEYGAWDASGHECSDINPNHPTCEQPVMQRTVTAVYVDRRVPLGTELEPHTRHADGVVSDDSECGRCAGSGVDPANSAADAPCRNCQIPYQGARSVLDWQRIYDRGFDDARAAKYQPRPTPAALDLRPTVRELRCRFGGPEVARELYRQAEQRT